MTLRSNPETTRAWQQRSAEKARARKHRASKRLGQVSQLRAASKRPGARRRRGAIFGRQAKLCRVLSCCACGRPSYPDRTTAHHEPPVGAGGRDGDTVPLCSPCHAEVHAYKHGRAAWWKAKGVDPELVKARLREAVRRAA